MIWINVGTLVPNSKINRWTTNYLLIVYVLFISYINKILPSLRYRKGDRTQVRWGRRYPCKEWWGLQCRIMFSSSWLYWMWCRGTVHHSKCRIFHFCNLHIANFYVSRLTSKNNIGLHFLCIIGMVSTYMIIYIILNRGSLVLSKIIEVLSLCVIVCSFPICISFIKVMYLLSKYAFFKIQCNDGHRSRLLNTVIAFHHKRHLLLA